MGELIKILKELIDKITAKQAFITILVIIFISGGYVFYRDFNDTRVEIAKLKKSEPSSINNFSPKKFSDKTDYFVRQSKSANDYHIKGND